MSAVEQATAVVHTGPLPTESTEVRPLFSEAEWMKINEYITEALKMLAADQVLEEGMFLGDLCAELRDLECDSRWLDDIIFEMFRTGRSEMGMRPNGEMWVRIHPLFRAMITADVGDHLKLAEPEQPPALNHRHATE